jgi:putative ABC transport system substrate-binding protein
MRRRQFITLFGAAAGPALLRPLAARAQQPSMPVIGLLGAASLDSDADNLRAFRQTLKDTGYVEGENVAIVSRSAENRLDRLPALAAELVHRKVAVIAAVHGAPAAFAAKTATATIPILFAVSEDPVRIGLVASLARPGGNLTGINFLSQELAGKRLELLRELVPGAARVAVLVNPANAGQTDSTLRDVQPAARAIGLHIQVLSANTSDEIDAAFATFERERPDALFVGSSAYFTSRRVQLVQLAARHVMPAAYVGRQYVEHGGLMSYGANLADAWRQLGDYTGRILKGAKPADLPVVQASKFELVINHQTARMLRLNVPPTLLATADEVIE